MSDEKPIWQGKGPLAGMCVRLANGHATAFILSHQIMHHVDAEAILSLAAKELAVERDGLRASNAALCERLAEFESNCVKYSQYAKNAYEREAAANARLDPLTSELLLVRTQRDEARFDAKQLHDSLDESRASTVLEGQKRWNAETEREGLRAENEALLARLVKLQVVANNMVAAVRNGFMHVVPEHGPSVHALIATIETSLESE